MEKSDKKIRSILYLALGNEGRLIFAQKFSEVKILWIRFVEFWHFLNQALIRKPKVTFRRRSLPKGHWEDKKKCGTILRCVC